MPTSQSISSSPYTYTFDGNTQAIVVETVGLGSVYFARFPGVSALANEGSLDIGNVRQFYVSPMYFIARDATTTIQITTVPVNGASGSSGPFVGPEKYGAGYNGSASDDWGPAINQAMVDATAANAAVLLTQNYGIRTTVVWPAGSSVPIWFAGPFAQLQKLADVILIDASGANSGAGQGENRYVIGPGYLDGGSNTGWTQPLYRQWFTGDSGTHDMRFLHNYGMAVDGGKETWDPVHKNPQVLFCGGQDGATPAMSFGSVAGDGGNSTNSVILENPRIEAWRSGAIWAVGASPNDKPFEVKITGSAKIEVSGTSPIYGPAIKLANLKRYTQEQVRITTDSSGAIGTGQTTPFHVFYDITNCAGVDLGRMFLDIGAITAGDATSLIHLGGGNQGITYDGIYLLAGGDNTNKPASVFLWSGTNELVQRGPIVWSSTFMGVPTDSGAPTNYASKNGGTFTATPGAVTTVNIPHLIGDNNGSGNQPIVPSRIVMPVAANAAARGAPLFYLTADASNITLNFASALTAATSYSWYWGAEA